MGVPRKPNHARRQLGRTLRKLRERARMSQDEVAREMHFSKAKVSRLELGQLPNRYELMALLDLYGVIVSDYTPYLEMLERAQERGWWHIYGLDDRGYVPLEDEACLVREFQLGYIPGLLQTEAYMRAGFNDLREQERADNDVAVRLHRQRRLTEEPTLRLHAILDETVLRRPVLPPAEQRAQLEHLIAVTALPTVTVQVIPLAFGAHNGRSGTFVILSYPDPKDPDIAYLEHGFGAWQTEKESQVRAARLAFEHLADLALDEPDSIALIRRVIAET
ncbi:helix-turn-helix domain-containing protein [Amycolatopsis aidingensis]|uniref:helix-turn-helix domain-containing protein n=1 Tax=Amycolatopsis aidingensis TaxID=2842453 RepID=UPI001C0D79B0|nr:helix-turn-helix transcriptional regulator [Amycolatopsis aidingensis]